MCVFVYFIVCMYECMYICMYLLLFPIVLNVLMCFSLEGLAAGLVLLSRGAHPQLQPFQLGYEVYGDWGPGHCASRERSGLHPGGRRARHCQQ